VYSSRIWLTRSGTSRLAVRGALELQGDRLTVVLDDRRPPGPMVEWLESRLGERSAAREMAHGDHLRLVDRPARELVFVFCGAEQDLEIDDGRGVWHLCFTEPGSAVLLARWQRRQHRKAARWKELLAAALDVPAD
jgi:hypothetical protein